MMKRLAVAVALLFAIAACGSVPTSGEVYKAPYTGESYWYSSHCAAYSSVQRSRTTVTYDAKGRPNGTRTSYYTDTVCIMTVMDRHTNPPYWELCLKADDDPKHKGCTRVPQEVWNRYPVGSHYPDAR